MANRTTHGMHRHSLPALEDRNLYAFDCLPELLLLHTDIGAVPKSPRSWHQNESGLDTRCLPSDVVLVASTTERTSRHTSNHSARLNGTSHDCTRCNHTTIAEAGTLQNYGLGTYPAPISNNNMTSIHSLLAGS